VVLRLRLASPSRGTRQQNTCVLGRWLGSQCKFVLVFADEDFVRSRTHVVFRPQKHPEAGVGMYRQPHQK
jgi:hypothetical protein